MTRHRPLVLACLSLFLVSALDARELAEVSTPQAIRKSFSPKARLHLLNFWATWCIPCVKEFKDLKAIDEAFDARVEIVGVSLDDAVPDKREVRKEIAREFLEKEKVSFRNVYYTGRVPDLQDHFNFEEIPTTILFDGKGREIWRHQGIIDRRDVIRRLKVSLDEKEKK